MLPEKINSPAKSRIFEPAWKTKVFWFFSSEKNKILLFLKKRSKKTFNSAPAQTYGIWPEGGVGAT
jgi:hypothetical protein